MCSSYERAKLLALQEIENITTNAFKTLGEKWFETFDAETCETHVKAMPDHIAMFYNEIIQETNDRQLTIQKKISELHEEAANLRKLLKVDVELSPQKGLPLHTIQVNLDKKLINLRAQLKERRDQIFELLVEQEALCEELNEIPRPLVDDRLPTEDEIFDFKLHLDSLKAEKNNRIYLISCFRKDIKSLMEELEVPIRSEEEEYLLNDRSLPLSQANVDRLKNLLEHYVAQMEEIRESIDGIKKKLEKIWDRIETSPATRQKFSKYKGYSQTTYDHFYKELKRCEEIKRQNIKLFVDKYREEIQDWWIKTMKSDAEKKRFTHFTNDWYTEDLLALHELELEELKAFYYENEKIFALINERNMLWNRMQALESKAMEPGRYNNRGGQLLKEEKERKTICSKLPKIEEQLKVLVHGYEQKHNRKFEVFGDDILQIIQMQWEEKKAKKEKLSSARKNVGTPICSRNVSSIRTPMSLRNFGGLGSLSKKLPTPNLFNGSSVPVSFKRRLSSKSQKDQPESKRNLISQFESSSAAKFKSPMKKIKPVIGSTIKRRSTRSSSNKNRRSKNKKVPQIKINDQTAVCSSSEATDYEIFEEHIHKEPSSRSSVMHSNESTISLRRNKKNCENTTLNKKKAAAIINMYRTPSKTQLNEHASVINKRDVTNCRNRKPSPSSSTTSSNRKLTTKNLPIII